MKTIETLDSLEQLTVCQWQSLAPVMMQPRADELEWECDMLKALYSLTEEEINGMDLDTFKSVKASLNVFRSPIKPRYVKTLQVNGRKYRPVYNPGKFRLQYQKELAAFNDKKPLDKITSLHELAALLLTPTGLKRRFAFWKRDYITVEEYRQIKRDVLDASFVDVFSILYTGQLVSLEILKAFLLKHAEPEEAAPLVSEVDTLIQKSTL